ncbi:MAG TPA: PAS domain-containing sensor histidine kinase [Balneolaceae bacterium]
MRRLEEVIDTILNRQQHPYETQQILSKIKRESQRRERLYESILSNTPDLAYIFDLDFKFIYANDATLQMWGKKNRDEAMGKGLSDLGYESWHVEMHHKELKYAVKTKEIVRGEVPFNNAKHGRRIYDYIFVPVIGKDGEVEAIAGTSRDITDQKKANETLEQRIAEHTEELQERAAKLRDLAAKLTSAKQQERKRLAAILHDDLQQLLVSAKMHISFIHPSNSSDTESADKAKKILDQAIHLARNLTTKLRPPALFEAGLSHALEWLAEDMLERHRLNIKIDKKDTDYSLSDDIKVLLFESIRELLFNVVKYAGTDKAMIRVRKDKGFLRVIVRDDGKGFNVETVRRKSTKSFGLFSVLDRLDALGGSVSIASQPGEGTTVELKVPVAPKVSARQFQNYE